MDGGAMIKLRSNNGALLMLCFNRERDIGVFQEVFQHSCFLVMLVAQSAGKTGLSLQRMTSRHVN